MKEYIERNAAIKEIYSEIERTNPMQATEVLMGYDKGLRIAAALVMNAPTADVVERVRGEWREIEDRDGDRHWQCSACGIDWYFIEGTPSENGTNFCPNCGADMRGEEHG